MNIENQEIRGWILRICQRAQPYGASFQVIEVTLMEAGFHHSLTEMKSHLKYLEEKGYITMEELKQGGVKRRINSITPKGVDLLEGNIEPDPGVLLDGC
jgi:DNA-binding PadR family transcriptional regulator